MNQSWVALSATDEETKPDFVHYGAHDLPVLDDEGKVVRVIAGSMLGVSSPVKTSSPMFYADISLGGGACVPLILSMMSELSIPWKAKSRLPVMSLALHNCSCFGPAIA